MEGGVPSETEGSSRGERVSPCGHHTQHCQAVPEGEDTEQDIYTHGGAGLAVRVRPQGYIARGIRWLCRSSGRRSP
ncbi:hypothetical protein Cfor_05422, partial [Coptotermes formosanus]